MSVVTTITSVVTTITSVSVATTATETFVAVLVAAMVYFSFPLFNLNNASLEIVAIQCADCGLAFFRNRHSHKPQPV